MYMCSTCKTRHASPTGSKCTRQTKRKAEAAEDTTLGVQKRRRTNQPSAASSPRMNASRAATDVSLEEESMDDLLARLDGPPFPSQNETIVTEAPSQLSVVQTSVSTFQVPGPSGQAPPNEGVSADMFSVLVDQVAILADTQTRERERVERESKANFESIRESMQQISQRFVAFSQSQTVQPPTPPVAITGVLGNNNSTHQATSGPASSSGRANIAVPPTSGSNTNLSQEQLINADIPIRTLRRDRPSANNATSILKELALLEAGGRRKKGGQLPSKCSNAQVEADWPDLYVYRLGGAEPTYDSLSMPEFIAVYLSIMEDVTTVCSMNANFT